MAKKLRKSDICLNCKTEINDYNYCPNCGQLNTHKQIPLKVFLHEMFGDLFTFDSKFFRSIIPLIKRPGHLTNEYNEGKRSSYVFPLRLYLFTSLMFFFFYSLSNFIDSQFFGSNNSELQFANADTLTVLLEKYDDEISELGKELLPRELSNKYILTKREVEKTMVDELSDTLSIVKNSSLPELKKLQFLLHLNQNFKFRNNSKKTTSEEVSKELNNFINSHPVGLALNKNDTLLNQLNYLYRVKSRNASNGVVYLDETNSYTPNIKATVDGESSDSSKFAALLEKQAKKMMMGGRVTQEMFVKDMIAQAPKAIFVLLPIFAFLLKLFYIRHKIYYINHLIFTLHIHSLFFIYIIILLFFSEWYVFILVFTLLLISIFMAMRRVYGQSRIKTFIKMGTILGIYFFCVSMATAAVGMISLVNL